MSKRGSTAAIYGTGVVNNDLGNRSLKYHYLILYPHMAHRSVVLLSLSFQITWVDIVYQVEGLGLLHRSDITTFIVLFLF